MNACRTAAQIDDLVAQVVPFAIGMADEIDDGNAINYAAQFYASVANGQSVYAPHLAGQAALELAGLDGADLPTLAWAEHHDPTSTVLVNPVSYQTRRRLSASQQPSMRAFRSHLRINV